MATHFIGYAYPSSTVARSLGAAKDGSWYLLVGNVAKRQPSYEAALAAAKELGTTPDRWSADHPDNAHFRTP